MGIDLNDIWADIYLRSIIIVVGSVLAGFLFDKLVARVLLMLAGKTETDVDDKIVEVLHKPIFWSVFMGGAAWAIYVLNLPKPVLYIVIGLIKTAAVFIWISALSKIGSIFLAWISDRQDKFRVVQPRTLPLFDIAVKVVVIGGGLYALMLSWDINVTGWLASAGILGLAIGFAAKDTLANLFAGVFILADAPYKLGDYIVLGTGERGKVVEIGMRSTRILTRDDIEIVVPNSAIAANKVINESSPIDKRRIRIKVGVSYSSDIDVVEETLRKVAHDNPDVATTPEPRVRFRSFGDSSLDYELLVWVDDPEFRGRVMHELNTATFKSFQKNQIEIPFPQRDVHMIPATPGPADQEQRSRMRVSFVVAVAEPNVIGYAGGLPWHLSADLRYFKRTTMGKPLVMGRKTWDSIGRPLPGRPNVVVTRQRDFAVDGVHVAHDLDGVLAMAEELARADGADEIMVIGGAQIFDAARPRADRIYLTEIHARFPGDVFFSAPDPARWSETSRSERHHDERSGLDYTFVVYDRH